MSSTLPAGRPGRRLQRLPPASSLLSLHDKPTFPPSCATWGHRAGCWPCHGPARPPRAAFRGPQLRGDTTFPAHSLGPCWPTPCQARGYSGQTERAPCPDGLGGHRNQQVTQTTISAVLTKACRRPRWPRDGHHREPRQGQGGRPGALSLQRGSRPVKWVRSRSGKEVDGAGPPGGVVRPPLTQFSSKADVLPPHHATTGGSSSPISPESAEAFTEIKTWIHEHKIKDLKNLLMSATGPRWQLPPPLPGVGGRK